MPPFVLRLLRLAAVGFGALTIASAVVNIIAAVKLIEPSDEASLGITRNEIIGWYIGPVILGLVLIWLGLRRWKSSPPKDKR